MELDATNRPAKTVLKTQTVNWLKDNIVLHRTIQLVIQIWEACAILQEQKFGAIFWMRHKVVSHKMKLIAIHHLILS